ncbi:MAG: Gfo/Idh/MocA family oxidoreductase [Pseudomonadota bacterium]
MTDILRVGLVGAGVFGGYHASKIAEAPNVSFQGVFSADPLRGETVAGRHGVTAFEDLETLLDASDAVIIATPATSHSLLVEAALEADCHVLVEKPLATSVDAATALADLAEAKQRVLQIGHQERYICDALSLFDLAEPPERIEFVRHSLPPRNGRALDVSVVWDLAIHDLDMLALMLDRQITLETARGRAQLGPQMDEVAARLSTGSCAVDVSVSRLSDHPQRTIRIGWRKGEALVDFGARQITVEGETPYAADFADAPADPLLLADQAFFEACRSDRESPIPARSVLTAIDLAERIERTIAQ